MHKITKQIEYEYKVNDKQTYNYESSYNIPYKTVQTYTSWTATLSIGSVQDRS